MAEPTRRTAGLAPSGSEQQSNQEQTQSTPAGDMQERQYTDDQCTDDNDRIEITLITSSGPLSKSYALGAAGALIKTPAQQMSSGTARRTSIACLCDLPAIINNMTPRQAIATGLLLPDQPDLCQITTKDTLPEVPMAGQITRTRRFFHHPRGRPCLLLLDVDFGTAPQTVIKRVEGLGGLEAALASVLPELLAAGYVIRPSTSNGIYKADTGETFRGSDGLHIYVGIADASDSVRCLRVAHERLWEAGLGWIWVSKGGGLLERSLIDTAVGLPERLIYEGAPQLARPLAQHSRPAVFVEGARPC